MPPRVVPDRSSRPPAGRMPVANSSSSPTWRPRRAGGCRCWPLLALAAVERINAILAIERDLNGLDVAARCERLAPLVTELKTWMQAEHARLSRHAEVAKATYYMRKRWATCERVVHAGQVCLTNNAAERALRGIA